VSSKLQTIAAAAALALITVGLSGCGGEEYKAKTGGSEPLQQKVNQGQPLYTPPPGAPGVPTGGPGGPGRTPTSPPPAPR